ncbi:MAG: hypothetical protein AMXMBFR84_35400 [Candidatus Hydrogenedentota bacterium]
MQSEEGYGLPERNEIVSYRTFDASREALYSMFEQPEHLIHWWGPKGFTNTFYEFDLRPGGIWRFEMQGPDGTRYELHKRFVAIAKPDCIVFDHIQPTHGFRMTMRFSVDGAGSRLEWRMVFESAEECDSVRDIIRSANEENFERLADYLKTAQTS